MISFLMSLLVLISATGYTAYASDETFGANAALEEESYTLESMLEYALEDERLAQAEYEKIMDVFDVTRPFSNIKEAEVKHEAALITLYEARALTVPEFDAEEHVIIPDSLEEIYAIGIEAEINNIAMYNAFLEQDLDEDVRKVFTALRDGSEKHLEAFKRASERPGGGRNRNR